MSYVELIIKYGQQVIDYISGRTAAQKRQEIAALIEMLKKASTKEERQKILDILSSRISK